MEIIKVETENAEVQLSLNELNILKNAFNEVYNSIAPWEFQTRVGIYPKEFLALLEVITDLIKNDLYQVQFSICELGGLISALNEVCNGIKVLNFETKIGKREEALQLLKSINNLLHQLSPPSPPIKYVCDPRLRKLTIKKDCYLETDGYQVIFHIKTITHYPTSVALICDLVVNTNDGEIFVRSKPERIQNIKLEIFLISLSEHIDSVKKNPQTELTNLLPNQTVFQVQGLSGSMISENEGFFTLGFMIIGKKNNSGDIINYVGAQSKVSFQNIQKFISSMREALDEIYSSE